MDELERTRVMANNAEKEKEQVSRTTYEKSSSTAYGAESSMDSRSNVVAKKGEESVEDQDGEEEGEEEGEREEEILESRTSPTPSLTNSSPITYLYLKDTTLLPPPSYLGTSTHLSPPCPPLTAYMSPFAWSPFRKTLILTLCCLATSTSAYTAGSYASAAPALSEIFHVSRTAVSAGITTFCTGFAVAPMILAPFSEIQGRYPVFVVSGILFEVGQIACAVTHSFPGMLVARFWVGVGASVFSTMVGGVISDLYHAEDRNTPMALFSGAAMCGTGLGPLVSGFVAQNWGWRWVFWVQVVTCGVIVGAVTMFFKETRGSILLSRKAGVINEWYEERERLGFVGVDVKVGEKVETQRIRWKVKSDEERESVQKMICISLYRPFHLLVTEPVVFFFSLWVSFAWAVLYLTFGSIPLVFQRTHHFDLQQTGAVFASMSIASIIVTILSIYQETFLQYLLSLYTAPSATSTKPTTRLFKLVTFLRTPSPESRLYFTCIESILLPIGLFWFGWTQFSHIPWMWPVLAVGCATMGIFSVYLATFNYLADAYHRYSSSALAAQSFCRNILGGVFPLVTVPMFEHLTFQGASSLLGGIGLLLTAVPWVLVACGPRIRARSKFAREIM